MNEQEQISQLSALFDGELPAQQADLVIRRAVKDPAMRRRWRSYALIGACLRGEPLAGAGGQTCVAEQVSARIADEAGILAPWGRSLSAAAGAGRSMRGILGRTAMGGAIAAAVAVMAIFVVRAIGPAADLSGSGETYARQPGAEANGGPQLVATATESAPRSYTTPGETSGLPSLLPNQAPLAHYVVAHSERAASALGFSYDLTEGTEVMTADEIEAHLR
jgi:negative regulator of sigma E activity